MKEKVMKNSILLVLSIIIFTFLFSKIIFADTQVDLNSFGNIESTNSNTTNAVTNNSSTNNTTNTANTANTINNTTPKVLSKTGSNTEIIFAVGSIILVGTTVYIYKKIKF